ncbi:MAG: hypothetical protein AB1457_08750 [Chloroflexota bacterium]
MNQNDLKHKTILSWLLLIVSLNMILAGVLIRVLAPQLQLNPYMIISIGLIFAGTASINLIKFKLLRQEPAQMHEWSVYEKDERVQMIRWRAGNTAFITLMVVLFLSLILFSITSSPQTGVDALWYFLAFLVVFPMAVYCWQVLRLQKRM